MGSNYPNDADGDVLCSIESSGSDMAKRMEIEFFVTSPTGIEAYAYEFREGGQASADS